MTLYNVTAEVGGRSPEDPRPRASEDHWEEIEARMGSALWDHYAASLHASEHQDDGIAITITIDSWSPGMAASQAVDILAAYEIHADAVEAMTTEEFDRRTDRIAPPS